VRTLLVGGTGGQVNYSGEGEADGERKATGRAAHADPLPRPSIKKKNNSPLSPLSLPAPPRALDAAQPFDAEARAAAARAAKGRLTVGIVGFGTFGQFLASRLAKAGHSVIATSRGDYSDAAAALGVRFCRDADDFCEAHPDVVVLATSILSSAAVLQALPLGRLKRSTLFVDVLSVKAFPRALLLSALPPGFDILCTHPMFGPDSGAGSWAGLPLVYEKVRVGPGAARAARVAAFLSFFEGEGCRLEEMSCEEHDRVAAGSQFLTHTVGRVLGSMGLAPTVADTAGYRSLLSLVDNTAHDSFDLYYGLFLYNPAAPAELERLGRAFEGVRAELFQRLHDRLRVAEGVAVAGGDAAGAARAAEAAATAGRLAGEGGGGNGVVGDAVDAAGAARRGH
jgi:arogenate dehydrogenase (NADP+)